MDMKFSTIRSCYIGPVISPEQFVAEHFFLYLAVGSITGYDSHRKYNMFAGEYCIVRRNQLARYFKQPVNDEFSKVVVIFDQPFLESFCLKYPGPSAFDPGPPLMPGSAFIEGGNDERIHRFIRSLEAHYLPGGRIEDVTAEHKREELLLLLLEIKPELAATLFDFRKPGKIDLEAFMNRNFRFNVSLERFGLLTGRSLSAFKREFSQVFHETPARWLTQKRLEEARFLIEQQGKKPADIYLDLGFEDLTHFSFAFRKRFGVAPGALLKFN